MYLYFEIYCCILMSEKGLLIIGNTDDELNNLLASTSASMAAYRCYYSENEEMFLRFERPFMVPSLPVHHNIYKPKPVQVYTDAILTIAKGILQSLPGLLSGLKYYFDPVNFHYATFYNLSMVGKSYYVYHLKINVAFDPRYNRAAGERINDFFPAFETNAFRIEADIIPIKKRGYINGVPALLIDENISDTWVGEQGRGYPARGIWIDREVNKFFSRLFIEDNKRIYPFYPLTCKYRTICQSLNVFSQEARMQRLEAHHLIRNFIVKYLPDIEAALSRKEFSQDIEVYKRIKEQIPKNLTNIWTATSVSMHLNAEGMREYYVEDTLC